VKAEIIKLLNELGINYTEMSISTGGWKYYFRLFGGHYCLFTSCWKDYGLHFVYFKRRGGKEYFQKIIDYQKNLDKIRRILEPIVEYQKQKYGGQQ